MQDWRWRSINYIQPRNQKKTVAGYHLRFPVYTSKIRLFHSSHTYVPASESHRITTANSQVTISMKKVNGQPLPFSEKDKDSQPGSAVRWGGRAAEAGSQRCYHRQTNFLLSKTTAYYTDEKTATHRPKHRAQPQSLKQGRKLSQVT